MAMSKVKKANLRTMEALSTAESVSSAKKLNKSSTSNLPIDRVSKKHESQTISEDHWSFNKKSLLANHHQQPVSLTQHTGNGTFESNIDTISMDSPLRNTVHASIIDKGA